MKKYIAIALISMTTISLSSTASAGDHDVHYNGTCDVSLSGDINFNQGNLSFGDSKSGKILINAQQELYVDGSKIELNDKQQVWVENYYESIESSIPKVIDVAKEGVKIANYAVTEVLVGLLGEGSQTVAALSEKLESIESGLNAHVYQDPGYINFNTQTIEQDIGISSNWDSQYESILEEIMPTAIGEVLIALGKNMMSGDGSIESFEQRMERMGEEIEQNVQSQTAAIERETEILCEHLERVEIAQQDLKRIPELQYVNLLQLNNKA